MVLNVDELQGVNVAAIVRLTIIVIFHHHHRHIRLIDGLSVVSRKPLPVTGKQCIKSDKIMQRWCC